MLTDVHRSAAFFDLDKTIIARSSALAFGRPFRAGGLINRRAALKAAYAQLVYLVAGADEDQMNRMRDYVTEMCTGWDVQQVKEIVAETLFEIVDPLIYAEAADLIEEHKASRPRGRDRIEQRRGGRRADRRAGRRRPGDRHPDGGREWPLHGRGGVLRVRAGEGAGDAGARPGGRVRPGGLLRLQRLSHRPSDAGGGRASDGGEPGPGVTPRGPRAGLAGAGVQPARVPSLQVGEHAGAPTAGGRPAVGVGAAVAGLAWYAARRRSAAPAAARTGRRRPTETLPVRRSSAGR